MSNHRDDKPRDEFDGRTYLFIRTNPADNGTEPLPSPLAHWVSPDITVTPPGGGTGGEAAANQQNHVEVIVTNAGGITAVDAFVDAFFADPSTAFTPATATLIDGGYLTVPGYATASIIFPWTPMAADAGHRCLLARVSLFIPPDTYANGAVFDVRGDRHVAQRNINVASLATSNSLKFPFLIVNPDRETREIRVMAAEVRDPQQLMQVRAAMHCGAAQFGETPLQHLGVSLCKDAGMMPSADRPLTRGGDIHRTPRLAALPLVPAARPAEAVGLRLGPGEVCHAILYVDRNPTTRRGDLHAVQVTQVDERGTVTGGLTVVVQH